MSKLMDHYQHRKNRQKYYQLHSSILPAECHKKVPSQEKSSSVYEELYLAESSPPGYSPKALVNLSFGRLARLK
jgi:hypothetical protein